MPTKIEWARNPDGSKGETWPVVTGCTPVSEGCRNCYAARMAATRLRDHPRYKGLAIFHNGKAKWMGEVRLNYDVLEQPLHWRKPRMVFVASMGDLFHDDVPPSFICEIWQVMRECPQHTFQILTKRAQRMFEIITTYIANDALGFEPLPNVWGLVTAENQPTADERIPWLLRTPFAVRGVSVEPMLGPIDLSSWLPGYIYKAHDKWIMNTTTGRDLPPLSWVICGGESGPGARPMHPNWVRSLKDQCQAAGTPFFLKQWGEYLGIDYTGEKVAGMPAWTRADGLLGQIGKRPEIDFGDGHGAVCIGRKRAGRLLDGQVWDQFPVSVPGQS